MLEITASNGTPSVGELERALAVYRIVNEYGSVKPIKLTFESGLTIAVEDIPEEQDDEQD